MVRTQRNARIHLCIAVLVIGSGAALRLTPTDWAVLALTIGLVWAAECFNSAVEALVDLVKAGKVEEAEALRFSPKPDELKMNLKGIFSGTSAMA